MAVPQVLADTLRGLTTSEYVRFVADWLGDASDLEATPRLTGDPVVDALVAAAAAHVAFTQTGQVPAWTEEPERILSSLWYPGPDALFPHALVHSLLFAPGSLGRARLTRVGVTGAVLLPSRHDVTGNEGGTRRGMTTEVHLQTRSRPARTPLSS